MDISQILEVAAQIKASDICLTAASPPSFKLNGQWKVVKTMNSMLSPDEVKDLVFSLMNESQKDEFITHKESNFGINNPGLGRFRVSAFQQKNFYGMVLRRIETIIPSLDELGVPSIVKNLIMMKKGLILVVGSTGMGKSTTLASMLDCRNQQTRSHIITVEDPIEFIHQHKNSLITQREVGIDTESYSVALKSTLRQSPDVVMIGEIRSSEVMNYAISFAETGHLCIATLHANNADQALDRIIHFFPPEQREQIQMELSLNLRSIIAQQLIADTSDTKRLLVMEILINTPSIAELIRKGEVHRLKALMEKSDNKGMITFDESLFELYKRNQISYESALSYADSANNLRLMIKLNEDGNEAGNEGGLDLSNLSLVSKDQNHF